MGSAVLDIEKQGSYYFERHYHLKRYKE